MIHTYIQSVVKVIVFSYEMAYTILSEPMNEVWSTFEASILSPKRCTGSYSFFINSGRDSIFTLKCTSKLFLIAYCVVLSTYLLL